MNGAPTSWRRNRLRPEAFHAACVTRFAVDPEELSSDAFLCRDQT